MASSERRPLPEDATETAALLASALAHDQAAWKTFCQRYDSLITTCVLRVLRRYGAIFGRADLADLVADVWLALVRDDCRKLRAFDAARGCRLSSWLGLIATNATIDQLRARSIETAYLEELPAAERLFVEADRPDAHLERREAEALAREALGHLSAAERQLVDACYGDVRSPAELADELGVQINTIYSRKFKVRQKLAGIVAALHPDAAGLAA